MIKFVNHDMFKLKFEDSSRIHEYMMLVMVLTWIKMVKLECIAVIMPVFFFMLN